MLVLMFHLIGSSFETAVVPQRLGFSVLSSALSKTNDNSGCEQRNMCFLGTIVLISGLGLIFLDRLWSIRIRDRRVRKVR